MKQLSHELEQLLDQIRADLGCDFCSIGLIHTEEQVIYWRYSSGQLNEKCRRITERTGRGIGETVIRIGRAVELVTSELFVTRRIQEFPILLAEKLASAFVVPIVVGRQTLAVLLAGNRREHVHVSIDRHLVLNAGAQLTAFIVQQQNNPNFSLI
ncbi:histidine kinase [Paenibacillus baekrokdamisoli]|uniref:Histidine kinase n=1 Tax=Paenibacillus baekrokdamisoli TaxID=1712516 RepID=A0A3G9JMN7_9BACL|nr:GAF domain-containing protein [Paenibacillus baekrokdamisoli]MBB3071883.1 signal transduction protein with GAF and PtsI domain [Paenibacillus baekrokdamisoli]BBH24134.1 histidine kinase [Paenibacillus baekrokdamisoli]